MDYDKKGSCMKRAAGLSGEDKAVIKMVWFLKRGCNADPDKKIFAAVLEQSIRDLMLHSYKSKLSESGQPRTRIYQEVSVWFLSTNKGWVFTFEQICELLDINSSQLRGFLISKGYLNGDKPDVANGLC